MRVSMKRDAPPLPCETMNYGEVEDYTVNISPTAPPSNLSQAVNTTRLEKLEGIRLFPNPTGEDLNIVFPDKMNGNEGWVKIYNLQGAVLLDKALGEIATGIHTLHVYDFTDGIYIVKIEVQNHRDTLQKLIVAHYY